jgi:hypothetical protein
MSLSTNDEDDFLIFSAIKLVVLPPKLCSVFPMSRQWIRHRRYLHRFKCPCASYHWRARWDLKQNHFETESVRYTWNTVSKVQVHMLRTLPSGETLSYYNLRAECLTSLKSPFRIIETVKNLFKAFDFKTRWSQGFGMPIEFHSRQITNFPESAPFSVSSLFNSR